MIKITTWNVNGIRACLSKGLWDWVRSANPDILCLQEIKARPEQVDRGQREIDGYENVWNPAQRPGYSGVAIYTQVAPLETRLGMEVEKFDIEGRVIQMRFPGFSLFNIYFPNGQRGHERVVYKLEFYAQLLEVCKRLQANGEKLILTGDFNTAHNELDLANPDQNRQTSGFLDEERKWIDLFISEGFVDVYRTLYPDKVQYTWWTYRFASRLRNLGWRIDYFLVSKALMPSIRDVVIHDEVIGSDHCPVTLYLDL